MQLYLEVGGVDERHLGAAVERVGRKQVGDLALRPLLHPPKKIVQKD